MTPTTSVDEPISTLTVGELQKLIAETIRQIIREEVHRDYYVNEEGFRILYEGDDIAPEYLAQLAEDYEAIQSGRVETIAGEAVLQEMKASGVQV